MAENELTALLRAKGLRLPEAVREWYSLAAHWKQGGIGVWVPPAELAPRDAWMIQVYGDTQGATCWGVRIADVRRADPPVVDETEGPDNDVYPSFSKFVAAMIINEVIFGDEGYDEQVDLDPESVRRSLKCLVPGRYGDVFTDGTLESASVVAFTYPNNGPAYGIARTQAGCKLLERL
jgi:hypothetical protein